MKRRLQELLARALATAVAKGAITVSDLPTPQLEAPRERQHGDLASNIALTIARAARMPPRAIAETILAHLDDPESLLASAEVAGPGFLNFTLSADFWRSCLQEAEAAGDRFGASAGNAGRRAHVEYVSANPTGPLTVGHGRNAVIGDTIARLLEATGATVLREYYFNNAGRQMTLLGASTWARYQELLGRRVAFPEDGYQGEYITAVAADVRAQHGDGLTEGDLPLLRQAAEDAIFADIRRTLERMSIRFDAFVSETALHRDGDVTRVLDALRAAGLVEERDGAIWLRGEAVGLRQDRVLVKSSGEPAYRLPDVAYHRHKLEAGTTS